MDKIIVQIAERQNLAKNIIGLKLKPVSGSLPEWSAGSHIDIFLPNGQVRQYSICNNYGKDNCLILGILVEEKGRGGSLWLGQNATVGSELTIRKPRNHFKYLGENGKPKIFVAGGIGITPLLPMIEQAEADNSDWVLHYVGRRLEDMAFIESLKNYGDKVKIYPRNISARPDFTKIMDESKATEIYCCGPESMIDAIEALGHQLPNIHVITERFSPKIQKADDKGFDEFEVVFSYSNITAKVNKGQSILEVAEASGIYAPNSCAEGTCGSCETPILSGAVVHLDSVLSADEKTASKTMMICVSRAKCARLELDM